jgi:hypothetical protein
MTLTTTCERVGLSPGNFVGLCLMALAPVLAIVISSLRFKGVGHEPIEIHYNDPRPRGRAAGGLTVLLGLGALGVMGAAFLEMLHSDGLIRQGTAASEAIASTHGLPLPVAYLAAGGAAALLALLIGGSFVRHCEGKQIRASMAPRLGTGLGVLALGAAGGLGLAYTMMTVSLPDSPNVYDNRLSAVSYVILAAMLGLIVGGLGWCFYRAIKASGDEAPAQVAEEV